MATTAGTPPRTSAVATPRNGLTPPWVWARAVLQALSTTTPSERRSRSLVAKARPLTRSSEPSAASQASQPSPVAGSKVPWPMKWRMFQERSEEHTSELQSRPHLVCRLLLEKKKKKVQILDYDKLTMTIESNDPISP